VGFEDQKGGAGRREYLESSQVNELIKCTDVMCINNKAFTPRCGPIPDSFLIVSFLW
jgi:hypothetical protein